MCLNRSYPPLKQQKDLESVDELAYIAAKRFESIGAFEEAASFFNEKIWAEQESGEGNLMKKFVLCVSILAVILSGVALTQLSTVHHLTSK
ncbi:Response regulator aspartate phosphatase [Bacillus atrophaeus]|nr:Response regulator aspartate phosphatase [Bacillus atrophaeus]